MSSHPPALRGLALILLVALMPLVAAAAVPDEPDATQDVEATALAAPVERDHAPVRHVSRSAARSSAQPPALPAPVFVGADGERITVARIRTFLLRHRSPMAPYAELIVRTAAQRRVDPRVVVAIAGHESVFGRVRRGFNAWGWSVRTIRYSSWENAILRFTKAFSIHYPGMRNGNFWSGASRYDPPDPSSWARRCRSFFDAI